MNKKKTLTKIRTKTKKQLPLQPIEKIMEETTIMHISSSGSEMMRNLLDEFLREVSKYAAELARFSRRITIKDRDVSFAYEKIREKTYSFNRKKRF